MRTGIFGGSFDPIHYGHLILAEQCREQNKLDQVLFVPAAMSPLKPNKPYASDKHRLEMLSLAIAGHHSFEISAVEIERGGKSFTVDTLSGINADNPEDELFLLIGEDSLDDFEQWKSPKTICELATPLVVRRPTAKNITEDTVVNLSKLEVFMDEQSMQRTKDNAIVGRWIDISSTDIRERIKKQKSVRYLMPRAVEKYIETNKLYCSE